MHKFIQAIRLCRRALPILMLTIVGTSNASVIVELDFNSLPSAQGWTKSGSAKPESDIWSLDSDTKTLTLNTIGKGFSQDIGPESMMYFTSFNSVDTINVSFRARVSQEEISAGGYGQSFVVGLILNDVDHSVVVGTSGINAGYNHFDNNGHFDGTTYHDYNIIINPKSDYYTVLIDGALAVGNTGEHAHSGSYVILGDGSSTANTHAEITRLVVSQSADSGSVVPEPSTYLAGLSALGILGMFGRRTRG